MLDMDSLRRPIVDFEVDLAMVKLISFHGEGMGKGEKPRWETYICHCQHGSPIVFSMENQKNGMDDGA